MGSEGLMTSTLVNKSRVFAEARKHSDLELLAINDGALRLTEHLSALQSDLFDSAVVELKELAFKRYNDVLFTILSINPGKFILVRSVSHGSLDVRIGRTKEALKNHEVIA